MLNHSQQREVLHSFNKPTPVLPNSARCSFFATENLSYAMDVLLEAKNFESGQLQNRLIPRLQIKRGPKGTSMGVMFVSISKGISGRGQPQCAWHCWWKYHLLQCTPGQKDTEWDTHSGSRTNSAPSFHGHCQQGAPGSSHLQAKCKVASQMCLL